MAAAEASPTAGQPRPWTTSARCASSATRCRSCGRASGSCGAPHRLRRGLPRAHRRAGRGDPPHGRRRPGDAGPAVAGRRSRPAPEGLTRRTPTLAGVNFPMARSPGGSRRPARMSVHRAVRSARRRDARVPGLRRAGRPAAGAHVDSRDAGLPVLRPRGRRARLPVARSADASRAGRGPRGAGAVVGAAVRLRGSGATQRGKMADLAKPTAPRRLSPSRLNDFLGCEYRTWLDLAARARRVELVEKSTRPDASCILERGRRHEAARSSTSLEARGPRRAAHRQPDPVRAGRGETEEAMRAGREVIHQAVLPARRLDRLRRLPRPGRRAVGARRVVLRGPRREARAPPEAQLHLPAALLHRPGRAHPGRRGPRGCT